MHDANSLVSQNQQLTEIHEVLTAHAHWCEFFKRVSCFDFESNLLQEGFISRRCRPRQSIPGMILRRHRWCIFSPELLSSQSYVALKSAAKNAWIYPKPRTRPENVPKRRQKLRILRTSRRFGKVECILVANFKAM